MSGEFGRVRFEDIDSRTNSPKPKVVGGEILRDNGWTVIHHSDGSRTEVPNNNVICVDYPKGAHDGNTTS